MNRKACFYLDSSQRPKEMDGKQINNLPMPLLSRPFRPEKNGYGLTQPSGVYPNYPARCFYLCVWGPGEGGRSYTDASINLLAQSFTPGWIILKL